MLTGKRPFDGEDVTEIVGAIVHKTPDLDALPRDTPDSLKTLVRLCLVKDLKGRLHDAGDVRLVLDGSFDTRRIHSGGDAFKTQDRLVAGVVAGLAVGGTAASYRCCSARHAGRADDLRVRAPRRRDWRPGCRHRRDSGRPSRRVSGGAARQKANLRAIARPARSPRDGPAATALPEPVDLRGRPVDRTPTSRREA